jgi:hypothetical protein
MKKSVASDGVHNPMIFFMYPWSSPKNARVKKKMYAQNKHHTTQGQSSFFFRLYMGELPQRINKIKETSMNSLDI